jgi:AcrR family transcriptional regulator
MSNPRPPARRTPQQERGERRLAQLLEAAASVMAEAGYDAATMTEIAERANASIGTLYQYFPDKEAIVRALRQQYVDEFEVLWVPLKAEVSKLSLRQLVDRFFDIIIDYFEKRPAYFPVLNAPGTFKRDPAARNRLRGHFVALFRERRPGMTPEAALRIANVTVQVFKAMHPLYADASGSEKDKIVQEFKLLLLNYLSARLKSG